MVTFLLYAGFFRCSAVSFHVKMIYRPSWSCQNDANYLRID